MDGFVIIIDRESTDPRKASNGGDYDEGRTIAIEDGRPVAVRFWSSADLAYCPHVGKYAECDEDCEGVLASAKDAEGWEQGQPLATELLGVARRRLASGQFARIAGVPPFPGGPLERHLGKYSS